MKPRKIKLTEPWLSFWPGDRFGVEQEDLGLASQTVGGGNGKAPASLWSPVHGAPL